MNSIQEIKDLADLRLQEARILLANGYPDGAYYLGGYALELAMKMVKDTLVIEVKSVLDSFIAEGKEFTFAALVPVYPGLPSTSYVLLLNGEWLQQMSIFESTRIIIERIFEVISDPEIRQKIDSVDVWLRGQVYQPGIEAIIIMDVGADKISRYFNYAPTPAFSGSLFSSGSLGY